jgi:hypothetical protein
MYNIEVVKTHGVEQYKKMLKSEVCQQRTIQLVFIGPKDSDKTSLWHDILGIRHEQEDSKRSVIENHDIYHVVHSYDHFLHKLNKNNN